MKPNAALLIMATMLPLLSTAHADQELFTVGDSLVVELEIPDEWSATPQDADAEGGIAIRMAPPGKVPLVLLVTPIMADKAIPDLKLHVKSVAEKTARRLQDVAVEDNLTPRVLSGPHCEGFYVSVTDRTVEKPSLEDFKYLDQGLVTFGDFMMTFTLLTNVADAPERVEGLNIVRSARQFGSSHPTQSLAALSLSSVRLGPEDISGDCDFIDGEHAVSIQARTFYSMEELQHIYGDAILDRAYQSFKCGRENGTVYYYQYKTEADVLSALPSLKALIWGEDHPSRMHPERFLLIHNVLAIVSSKRPERFVDLVKARKPAG